ncbi:MAG: hypothetical protein ACOX6W_10870 [Lentisphaeria bacterium]
MTTAQPDVLLCLTTFFIIIPCYNESAVIRQTVEQLLPLGHQNRHRR